MFASVSTRAPVCLRCQVRLFRRERTWQKRTHWLNPVRPFESQANTIDTAFGEARNVVVDGTDNHPNVHGEQVVRESESRTVDVTTLANPTKLLILNDNNGEKDRSQTPVIQSKIGKPPPSGTPVWQDDLIDDLKPATESEYLENIDMIKNSWKKRLLKKTEWLSLRDQLNSSFTERQILSYLAKNQTQDDCNPVRISMPSPGIVKSSGWREGHSVFFGKELETASSTSSETKLMRKEYLADEILRRCWNFKVRDVVGELHLRLHPRDMALVLMDNDKLVDMVKRHETQLDLSRSRCILRLTAIYTKCMAFVNQLQAIVGAFQTTSLAIPDTALFPSSPIFDREFLDHVGEQTTTFVELSGMGKDRTIHFSYTNKDKKSRVDEAILEVLLNALPSSLPHGTFQIPQRPELTMRLPIHPDAPSWIDGQTGWWRAAFPISSYRMREVDRKAWRTPCRRIRSLLYDSDLGQYSPSQTPHAESIYEELSALPCHILQKNVPNRPYFIPARVQKKSPAPHMVSIDNPGVLPFLQKLTPSDNSLQICRIRYLPSPLEDANLPPLEIVATAPRVPPGSAFKAKIDHVFAVIEERVADVQIPDYATDLRVSRRIYLELKPNLGRQPDSEAFAGIDGFSSSRWGRGDYAPMFLRFDVPRNLLHRFKGSEYPSEKESLGEIRAMYIRESFGHAEPLAFTLDKVPIHWRKVQRRRTKKGAQMEIDVSNLKAGCPGFDDSSRPGIEELSFEDFFSVAMKVAKGLGDAAVLDTSARVPQADESSE